MMRLSDGVVTPLRKRNGIRMNQIIYIVGLVVIVLVILGFFGLR